jgi:hypothetical protein
MRLVRNDPSIGPGDRPRTHADPLDGVGIPVADVHQVGSGRIGTFKTTV